MRQAILDFTGEDSIVFDVTGMISLTRTIHIEKDLVIQGPGSDRITISGNGAVQVFDIITGDVLIADVTIANWMAPGGLGSDGSSIGGGGFGRNPAI